MEQMLLVVFDNDWGDEFQVTGYRLIPEAAWNAHQQEARAADDWPREQYFGTNEAFTYENAEDYLRHFRTRQITAEDAQMLQRIFGKDFGQFPELEFE